MMKQLLVLGAVAWVMMSAGEASAQETPSETGASATRVGLGVGGSLGGLFGSLGSGGGALGGLGALGGVGGLQAPQGLIALPIDVGALRIEPAFALGLGETQVDGETLSEWTQTQGSVGVLGRLPLGAATWLLLGGRLELTYQSTTYGVSSDGTSEMSALAPGAQLIVGVEHFFSPRVSLGLEAGLRGVYAMTSTETEAQSSASADRDSLHVATTSVLVVRVFFSD